MKIIFFKGKGDWQDKLIRLFTGGRYSHCEFLDDDGICYGVYPLTGKVSTYRRFNLNLNEWDMIEINHSKEIKELYNKTRNKGYDWLGIILSQILPFKIHSKNKYFCSEWCALALGYKKPHKYSPNKLYKRITK